MKELIPRDDFGVFADNKDIARVDSLYVAEFFEKNHKRVLEDIRKITEPESGLSEEFVKTNFKKDTYKDSTGRKLPCYQLTRDGFTMLVMGYTGQKAMKFKELYIKRFNEMEKFIKTLQTTRQEFPMLTEQIKLLHENPKPYHYSNEADMLNRLVIGMTAKQFRLANGIEKGQSIRPYLTEEQVHMLDLLQKIDIGLMVGLPNYEDRKQRLEWYVAKMKEAV